MPLAESKRHKLDRGKKEVVSSAVRWRNGSRNSDRRTFVRQSLSCRAYDQSPGLLNDTPGE